jgi:hypothetical protein
VTLNIFDRTFCINFPTRKDWSTECVDLVAPDGLVFFTFCEGRSGASVFSDILNVRESYALGSNATVFQSEVYAILTCLKYCISEGIVNSAISICFDSRATLLALKSYAASSRVVLECTDSLQGLVLSKNNMNSLIFNYSSLKRSMQQVKDSAISSCISESRPFVTYHHTSAMIHP